MRARLLLVAALALAVVVPVSADRRSEAKEQVTFGIELAQKGIWQAATRHFERATKIDPSYAAAWNNLGVGFEQLGEFQKAREAYESARELEPDNTFINNNYDLFREIYDRQNRRFDR